MQLLLEGLLVAADPNSPAGTWVWLTRFADLTLGAKRRLVQMHPAATVPACVRP